MPTSTVKWNDLSLKSKLNSDRLTQISTQLDLVTIATISLTQISPEIAIQAARDLKLESFGVAEWANSWQSKPHRQLTSIDEIRAIVLTLAHLAQEHQPIIRQKIAAWEQSVQHDLSLQETAPLMDYLNNFVKIYQDITNNSQNLSPSVLNDAAMKILVELLLYSSPNGHQRLWGALLQRSGVNEG
jgi:hypothetical protein